MLFMYIHVIKEIIPLMGKGILEIDVISVEFPGQYQMSSKLCVSYYHYINRITIIISIESS